MLVAVDNLVLCMLAAVDNLVLCMLAAVDNLVLCMLVAQLVDLCDIYHLKHNYLFYSNYHQNIFLALLDMLHGIFHLGNFDLMDMDNLYCMFLVHKSVGICHFGNFDLMDMDNLYYTFLVHKSVDMFHFDNSFLLGMDNSYYMYQLGNLNRHTERHYTYCQQDNS